MGKPIKTLEIPEKRLYFTFQEASCLRRILQKLENPSQRHGNAELSFYIYRRQLHEMTGVLVLGSLTHTLIQRLIYLTETFPFPEESKIEMKKIFQELRQIYRLEPALSEES